MTCINQDLRKLDLTFFGVGGDPAPVPCLFETVQLYILGAALCLSRGFNGLFNSRRLGTPCDIASQHSCLPLTNRALTPYRHRSNSKTMPRCRWKKLPRCAKFQAPHTVYRPGLIYRVATEI